MSDDEAGECLVAPIQTMFTPSARERIRAEAYRRHIPPSVLVRIVVLDWLATLQDGKHVR